MTTHRTDIQTRFGDTDALGHINNASYAAYAELGRLDFLGRLGKDVTSLILATLYIDFRRQVKFRESVHVDSWVQRLGRTSITLHQTIMASGERAADVKSVVVYFDYASGQPVELTPEIRAALEPFVQS
ncbi:MAG: thioesterase family protein [Gemmatimonadaceae bacterium]